MKTWQMVPVLALLVAGCARNAPRAPEAPSAAPTETVPEAQPADVPLPPVVIGEGGITPPNVVVSSWCPAMALSPPPHWTVVERQDLRYGEYGRVVWPKRQASISYVTHPATGRAVDEAAAVMVDMIKRGYRITKPINGDADPNRMEFGWLHPESQTRGYVVVRHYGDDGHVSFVFVGTWPSTLTARQDDGMHRTLEVFVNDTHLLSQ